jgi:hypothetical protein
MGRSGDVPAYAIFLTFFMWFREAAEVAQRLKKIVERLFIS